MSRQSNYDKFPVVAAGHAEECTTKAFVRTGVSAHAAR
jgi:hypothetical protein